MFSLLVMKKYTEETSNIMHEIGHFIFFTLWLSSKSSFEKSMFCNNILRLSIVPNEEEKSLWNDFMLFAEESRKAKKKKEAQVWINEDLKNILERIRCAGVRLPIKHLMNGILKTFITANQM